MKNRYNLFLLILLPLILFSSFTEAQIRFKSVNLEGGWYMPSHDYWKESSVISQWDNVDDVTSGMFGGLSVDIEPVKPITVRFGINYWTKSLSQQIVTLGITRDAELNLQYIPINMDVLADLILEELDPVVLYGGLGFGLNIINAEYKRTPEGSATDVFDLNAKDYFGKITAGLSVPITTQVGLGVEFRYIFGTYVVETYTTSGTVADFDSKFSGAQIVGMIKILLGE